MKKKLACLMTVLALYVSTSAATTAAVIEVSRTNFIVTAPIGSGSFVTNFTVRNVGDSNLIYQISTNISWLSVNPSSGSSTGEIDSITVTMDVSALSTGSHTGSLLIIWHDSSDSPFAEPQLTSIPVSLTVFAPIEMNTNSIAVQVPLGGSLPDQSFTVRNFGNTAGMNYTVSEDADWLTVSPTIGISTGEVDTITITYDIATLFIGTYTGNITVVAASATNSPKVCTVILQVIPPSILLNKSAIAVAGISGTNPASQSFTVRNNGNSGGLNYSISNDVSWLSANPASGFCSNETDTIALELNTALLAPGTYTGTVSVVSAAANNSPQVIQVQLDNKAGVIYVSASSGNDSASGFTWDSAKETIQAGVNALTVTNGTVLVSNGVYAVSSEILINKALALRSVNGPEATTIDAQWFSRCLNLGNYAVVVAGFSIQNGFAIEASPYGGAVYCTGVTPLLTNCVVSDSIALNRGGGVYYGSLIDCVVRGNGTLYAEGGGLYQSVIARCVVKDNTSASSGGGLYAGTASNSIFRGNSTAYQGGGMYNGKASECLFFSNSASYQGGGLYGTIANNCTIAGNSADSSAGGMYSGESRNSIVYYNTPNDLGSVGTVLYSCSPSLTHGSLGNITNAPSFVNSDSGNYRINASSPCIDAGINAYASGTVDVDGNPRFYNSRVDMGAYEYQGVIPDDDNDGLDNVAEAKYGSNPNNPDSDGDGFKDGWEVEHGWSPVRDDFSVRAYIENNPSVFGYYTEETVGDLAMGEMMVKAIGTNISVRLQMMKSSDLIIWTNAEQSVEWTIPATGKEFFRVRAQP